MSVELEGLNILLVKRQDAQVNYLDTLENESDLVNANSWFESHDGDVFKFKQTVCEYLCNAKELKLVEATSVVSKAGDTKFNIVQHLLPNKCYSLLNDFTEQIQLLLNENWWRTLKWRVMKGCRHCALQALLQ